MMMHELGPDAVTAVVLAGGQSQRMGQPKAQLQIDGQTLLDRILVAIHDAGISNPLVVGGDSTWISTQISEPIAKQTSRSDPEWIADDYPGEGPLGGLVTALNSTATRRPWILLLSCDLVSLDPTQLRFLWAAASDQFDAVVPLHLGKRQYLHALYRRSALDGLATLFASGERRLGSVCDGLAVLEVIPGEALTRSARDVDTPEEFRAALREH
jgi:molybdenum cofactor guanylyltransferase